jgi:hypothetical protein
MAAFGITLRPPSVDTGLIFSTDNSVASVLGPGVCCGMTSNWIATCKKLGRPVKTSGELSDPSSFVISQSGGEKGQDRGDQGIMRSAGLTPPAPTETRPVNFNTVATTLSGFAGYTFLTVHSDAAGHAMGSYVTATQWEFFDPNVGLYRFNSALGFVGYVQTNLAAMYPTLNSFWRTYRY